MTRERALMILVCGLWLLAPDPLAGAKTKARCADGRFRITMGEVLASVAPGDQWITVEDATIAVGGVCPAIAGTLGGSVRKTKVKAAWPAGTCTGLEGPVRLKAKIVSDCAVLKGTLRAPRARLVRRLVAARTSCGDGVLDAGEACETGVECPDGAICDAGCACQVPATTTSSTTVTSTTVTTTTFQGALAPDYVMFSGMETGSDFEPSLMLGCAPVQSPVRSGRWACGMTQDLFAPLRPSFSLTEVYVRVYHRIDVTTAPSAEAFAPIIVTDIAPQGVTAVDVGVSPDGSIRYRLRDRLNGINLGVTEGFPAGEWRRVELFTAIGDGDGRAELRIEGVPKVIVTDQHFGTTPMDTIFLSNNSNQYAGANGGSWKATFDDFAVTRNVFPGAGRVIARQGRPGAPTYAQWSAVGAASVSEAWSETPVSAAKRAETPAVGDPLVQTMLVAPFDQGINPIAPGNTIKACQTWARFGLLGSVEDRSYAIRRRIGGVDTDTPILGLEAGPKFRSDGLDGVFWRATLADLNASEVGAAKSGGAGGTGLSVEDAWLVCEYQ